MHDDEGRGDSNLGTCFVIQPFDGGPFDKRYEDVLVPAIREAGLEPYRVDRDPSVTIPIQEIENGIPRADVCLADISSENPNVWFELGYAIAAGKEVVLLWQDRPNARFPFDVQHRTIIRYRTESPSDFASLSKELTARLKAAIAKAEKLETVADIARTREVKGLADMEIVTLVAVAENAEVPSGSVSSYEVRQDVTRAGYRKIVANLGLTSLLRKGMISSRDEIDEQSHEPYRAWTVTEKGMEWLLRNQERLSMKAPVRDDEIPF